MKELRMVAVKSSQLRSAGYDESKNELYIEFISVEVYKYFNVPKRIFDSLLNSTTQGTYFYSRIRTDYKYEKTELNVKNSSIEIP